MELIISTELETRLRQQAIKSGLSMSELATRLVSNSLDAINNNSQCHHTTEAVRFSMKRKEQC